MVVEELVSPGSLGAVDIEVVVSLELCFTTLEGPGVLLPLLTNLRMILEKILQLRMLRHPFLVVNQAGVFPELLGDFRMVVEELISPGSLGAGNIQVVVLLILCFAALKDPRVILPLLADPWMFLEILLEGWMLLQILLVVNEVRILPQLLGNSRMAVEELVSPGSLGAGDFSAAHNEPVRIVHKRCRVRFNLLCYPRMVVKESLELGMLSQIVRIVDQRRVLLKLLVHPRMIE